MQSNTLSTSTSSSPPFSGNANFSSKSTLARLCRKLSPRRTPEQRSPPPTIHFAAASSELQRVFNCLDENGDGKISAAELRRCVRTVGGDLSMEDAEAAVSSSDTDGDGQLGFKDFQRLMEEAEEDSLRQAFGMYESAPGSGFISPASLQRMLSRLGDSKSLHDCNQMIRPFDINGDGLLSYHEFSLMMR